MYMILYFNIDMSPGLLSQRNIDYKNLIISIIRRHIVIDLRIDSTGIRLD